MKTIINRAKELNIKKLYGSDIFDYNIASQKLHESLGYKCVEIIGNRRIYKITL